MLTKENFSEEHIYVVTWEDFLKYPQADMNIAFEHRDNTAKDKIVKTL